MAPIRSGPHTLNAPEPTDTRIGGSEHLRRRLETLRRTYRGRLVIDLGGRDFVPSTGIATLIDADAYARRDGWVLQLRPGPPEVQRVFALCGLLRRLPFTAPR